MAMRALTTNEFKEAVSSGISVVDFWATWCGPCKMLSPILEELSGEMDGVTFYKVDADENAALCLEFDVRSIPTVIIFKDGEPVVSQIGAFPKVKMKKFIEDAVQSTVL